MYMASWWIVRRVFVLYSLERIHPEGDVHAWAVRQEGGQSGFLKQPKDQDFVPETHTRTHTQFNLDILKK